jgi:endogenous inhibitor of DNA gyrase (YacG/DUF329 family)
MNDNPKPKAKVIPLQRVQGKCPLCKRPAAVDFHPFCSKRCADKDLGSWLNESYKYETDETTESLEDEQ